MPVCPCSWATTLSEIHLLLCGLTHSNNPLNCDPAPTHPYPWLEFLCKFSCSVLDLFMVTRFKVFQHDFMHKHWCFKVNLLHHGLPHSHRPCDLPSAAAVWTYPWDPGPSDISPLWHIITTAQVLSDTLALAWTYPRPQIL